MESQGAAAAIRIAIEKLFFPSVQATFKLFYNILIVVEWKSGEGKWPRQGLGAGCPGKASVPRGLKARFHNRHEMTSARVGLRTALSNCYESSAFMSINSLFDIKFPAYYFFEIYRWIYWKEYQSLILQINMDDSDVSVCGNIDYISRRKISFYFKQKWDTKVDNDVTV